MVVRRLALVTVVLVVVENAVKVGVFAVEQFLRSVLDQENFIDGFQGGVLALIRLRIQQVVLAFGASRCDVGVLIPPVDD